MSETPVRYFGGPLDGTASDRPARSVYRDDDGTPIPAARGDREWCGVDVKPTRYYARQYAPVNEGGFVYVHATAWDDWVGKRERWLAAGTL